MTTSRADPRSQTDGERRTRVGCITLIIQDALLSTGHVVTTLDGDGSTTADRRFGNFAWNVDSFHRSGGVSRGESQLGSRGVIDV